MNIYLLKNKMQIKKILFLIGSLNAGGAETQLVLTAKGLADREYKAIEKN